MPSDRALTPAAGRRRSGDVSELIVKSIVNAMSEAIAVMMPPAASSNINDDVCVLRCPSDCRAISGGCRCGISTYEANASSNDDSSENCTHSFFLLRLNRPPHHRWVATPPNWRNSAESITRECVLCWKRSMSTIRHSC
jgi:hypothetical protein